MFIPRPLRFQILSLLFAVTNAQAAITLNLPGTSAATLNFTSFATGLSYPVGMAFLPDGSTVVGTTMPSTGSSGYLTYYHGLGQIVKLTDSNNDGIADGPPQVLATVGGAIASVSTAGDVIIAATLGNGGLNVNRMGLVVLAPSGGH